MPTRDQYLASIAKVKAGKGNATDIERTEKAAKQAGSDGNKAREALK